MAKQIGHLHHMCRGCTVCMPPSLKLAVLMLPTSHRLQTEDGMHPMTPLLTSLEQRQLPKDTCMTATPSSNGASCRTHVRWSLLVHRSTFMQVPEEQACL